MKPSITQEQFNRYVQGTASAAEAAAVRQWLAEPANQLVAQHWMRSHWDALDATPAAEEPNYEQLLRTVHQRLGLDTPRVAPTEQPTRPMWRRWAVAAAIAGTVAAGGLVWRGPAPLTPTVAHVTRSPYGQTRLVRLPDGSEATLNGNSQLRYAGNWGGDDARQPREVWLDGEAYFSVQHTPHHRRFVVHTTAGFNVEVLGTKFTVLRRREEARVVLLAGQVRIDFNDRQRAALLMKPGELVETHDRQPRAVVHRAVRAAPAYAAWKDGKLVLDETPIAELATTLRDTYGLEVVVASPELNQRKITGTVSIRDLDVLLLALEESFQLKVQRENNRLILSE